ncbi:hypothetical protein FB45DRAFT_942030 [Roridomyces roridus]|uniref:Uncharacterized protein n=1 Tax=Roridomyces roridus TaxID=1738132 RepID=A0AAD7FBT8_9AGAR|nr:hypothetical protein FB45DRAFT_942030 [Roridomyces roridus]
MSLWNFTLDDTSPFFSYAPYADGSNSGLGNGWIPWYSSSGYLSSNGEGGSGTSYHRTSLSGASVTLAFYGTGVDLYGLANCTYEVTLDNAPYSPKSVPSQMLASISNLTEATHTVTLKATPTGATEQLAFDRAMVFTPLVDNQVPAEEFFDNTDTSVLRYSGDWTPGSAPGIPNATVSHPWQETFDAGASVSMDIGVGAVGVSLWGMANWGNWDFNVSIDGGPPNTYNGSTFWKIPDALLYYQGGLDPTKNHTVTLANTTLKMKLALNSMRVYKIDNAAAAATSSSALPDSSSSSQASPSVSSSSSPGKHSSINAGAIAGPVVVVLLLGLVGAYFLWWRSRRNRSFSKPTIDMSQDNLYTDHPLTPHRPMLPLSNNSSAVGLTSPGHDTASMYSTQISGPPGATVMTWGYNDEQNTVSDSSTTTSRLLVANSASSSDGMSGHGHRFGEKAPLNPVAAAAPAPPVAAASTTQNTPDIDQIIELIAQRIDRGREGGAGDSVAPPQYRG